MTARDPDYALGRPQPEADHTVLVVELDPGEQLGGWMSPAGGTRIRFEGLLDLVALLERLRHEASVAEAEPRES